MSISIPNLFCVVLIVPSGSGNSTFARKHFLPTEILSSDSCRGMVGDDKNDLNVTDEAFEVLHFIARKRLALGKLTVVAPPMSSPRPASRSSRLRGSITASRWPWREPLRRVHDCVFGALASESEPVDPRL